jgi:hypothetical protein
LQILIDHHKHEREPRAEGFNILREQGLQLRVLDSEDEGTWD